MLSSLCHYDFLSKIVANFQKSLIEGVKLGMHYISQYKQDSEGLIVNTASIAAVEVFPFISVYCSTKSGVVMATRCFGTDGFYAKSNVKIIAIGPGVTLTDTAISMLDRDDVKDGFRNNEKQR